MVRSELLFTIERIMDPEIATNSFRLAGIFASRHTLKLLVFNVSSIEPVSVASTTAVDEILWGAAATGYPRDESSDAV